MSYPKGQWPQELKTLRVDVVGMPHDTESTKVPRFNLNKQARTIRIYRHPIERLTTLHKQDRWHKRAVIDSVVLSAVVELLGTDPTGLQQSIVSRTDFLVACRIE